MKYVDAELVQKKMNTRLFTNNLAKTIFLLSTIFGLVVLAVLVFRVLSQGIGWINVDFLTGRLSTSADRAGIMGAILGTLWLMARCRSSNDACRSRDSDLFRSLCQKRTSTIIYPS